MKKLIFTILFLTLVSVSFAQDHQNWKFMHPTRSAIPSAGSGCWMQIHGTGWEHTVHL